MKTKKDLHNFLFNKQEIFSVGSGVQLAFELLGKETMFKPLELKLHLEHQIIEFAKSYADQQLAEYKEKLKNKFNGCWCPYELIMIRIDEE